MNQYNAPTFELNREKKTMGAFSVRNLAARKLGYSLVALQMLITVAISAMWFFAGRGAAVSALLGGSAAVFPNLYFVYRFFATTHARQATRIIRTFYWGEFTKLLLTGILIILITRLWPNVLGLPLFSGLVGAYMAVWFAPLIILNNSKGT